MKRVKRAIYAGAVLEQLVYTVPDRQKNLRRAPRTRFATEEERAAHREGISRRHHARLVNENFNPESLYSTLTFGNDDEVYDFADAKRLRNNFVRRLQYYCPDAKIIIYMGRGKHTHRIHFHMLSHGIPEKLIQEQWIYGSVIRVEHLRAHNTYNGIDHGADYTGLANYLFDHWTPEQGGHRYKATRNLAKPMRDEAKEVKRQYTEEKPPAAPKGYKLVEAEHTPYGLYYFKYVKEPPKRATSRMRI